MPFLSKRLDHVQPSPTLAISARAAEMRAQGQDVISLSAGEPDFDTPDFIKEAAIKAIHEGKTKYTPVGGTPQLKEAIIHKFKNENNLDYTPAQVMASTGAKQIIYNAFQATLNPGDRVIIPSPYWVSYPDMVALAGGTPDIIRCSKDHCFKLHPEHLAVSIAPETKWVILNSPSNPTGAAYTREELAALGEVLLEHPHVHVLSDDIYEHIMYDDFEFTTIAEVVPELKDRTLTINGMSKAYSMTGWRLGFAAGPERLIKAMTTIQSQSTSNPCSITQAASIAGLMGSHKFMKKACENFQKRRDGALEILAKAEGLETMTPDGAFYLYPCVGKYMGLTNPMGTCITSDKDLAAYILEAVGVAVVPGEAFGLTPHLRLSYALDDAQLFEACNRIVNALGMLK
jgi:aspartate aminotransferase